MQKKEIRFIIVSGLAGAGKSVAMKSLEDLGYYCVDNLPVSLFDPFFRSLQEGGLPYTYIALALDVRDASFSQKFPLFYEALQTLSSVELIFLTSSQDVLLRRFKETRRVHPILLLSKSSMNLMEAIDLDDRTLRPLRQIASRIIDTSQMSHQYLKSLMRHYFSPSVDRSHLKLNLVSFGFKYGVPADLDIVWDVRCFSNPYYDPELKNKTGLEASVSEFVLKDNSVKLFIEKIKNLIVMLYPLYEKEGKSSLNIGIGCTGGKHRSVVIIEELAKQISIPFSSVEHRHSERWEKRGYEVEERE